MQQRGAPRCGIRPGAARPQPLCHLARRGNRSRARNMLECEQRGAGQLFLALPLCRQAGTGHDHMPLPLHVEPVIPHATPQPAALRALQRRDDGIVMVHEVSADHVKRIAHPPGKHRP